MFIPVDEPGDGLNSPEYLIDVPGPLEKKRYRRWFRCKKPGCRCKGWHPIASTAY